MPGEETTVSPVQTLFEVVLTEHNLLVEQYFPEIDPTKLEEPASVLKANSLMTSDDTFDVMMLRMWLFFVYLQRASAWQGATYSIPVDTYQSTHKFKPKVVLKFTENPAEVEPGFSAITAEVSFRIVKVPPIEINEPYARNLALKIKELFALTHFTFKKGKVLVTYKDHDRGYDFQLYVFSKSQAIKVIEEVLAIQGDPFDETLVKTHDSDKVYPAIPPLIPVYGKQVRAPREYPVGDVVFRGAELHIWGKNGAINLVDTTGKRRKVLVR
jgi:hypothetical protein